MMCQKSKSYKFAVIFLGITLLMLSPNYAQKAKIEKKDGVTIVHNPKEPVKKPGAPSSLVLVQDLCIGDNPDDENYMFSTIGGVMVDIDEDIIVIDEKEVVIKVFDKSGKHLRTFGKRGGGPGEFNTASRILLKGRRDIVVLDRGNNRLSYYSKEGKCLKEIPLGKHSSISRAKPDSRGYVYADTMTVDGDTGIYEIKRFDPELNVIETIARAEQVRKFPEVNPIPEWFMYMVLEDDRFIWGRNTSYEFTIHDPDGKPVKKIIKDYDPVKITKKEQEKIIEERFRGMEIPDIIKIVFPKSYPPFYYFICDDIGRIYVRTQRENNQGDLKWDVFDEEGIYILSFFLPPEELLYCIRNNKAHTFINDSEDGIPVVLRYRMDWR
ncbi:MAG: 6-bladed beta-propeller [Candidatus Aminicenantes bacterium]|nr:MAG: 6-bladed beta-propeller [Candidatus Aminicenantes bacterium]